MVIFLGFGGILDIFKVSRVMCNENRSKSFLIHRCCPKKRQEEGSSSPKFNLVRPFLKDERGYYTMNMSPPGVRENVPSLVKSNRCEMQT